MKTHSPSGRSGDARLAEDFRAVYDGLARFMIEALLTCLRAEISSVGGIGCAWQEEDGTIAVRVLCTEAESATRRLLAMILQQDPDLRIQGYDATRSRCILQLRVKVSHARLEQLWCKGSPDDSGVSWD